MYLLFGVLLIIIGFKIAYQYLNYASRKVTQLVSKESIRESEVKQEISELQSEMNNIRMMDEFAKYAKAQRKINALRAELGVFNKSRSSTLFSIKIFLIGSWYVIYVITVISIIWCYRSTPLLTLNPDWFWPLEKVVAFPTGQPGAVGLTFWLVVCRTVVNRLLMLTER